MLLLFYLGLKNMFFIGPVRHSSELHHLLFCKWTGNWSRSKGFVLHRKRNWKYLCYSCSRPWTISKLSGTGLNCVNIIISFFLYFKAELQGKLGADEIWNQWSVLSNIFGVVKMKSVTNQEIAGHLDLESSFGFHCWDSTYGINVVTCCICITFGKSLNLSQSFSGKVEKVCIKKKVVRNCMAVVFWASLFQAVQF